VKTCRSNAPFFQLLAAEKIPLLNIHHYMKPVYVDKRVDGSNRMMGTVVSVGTSAGKHVCVVKKCLVASDCSR
jgi:hypothetical protein